MEYPFEHDGQVYVLTDNEGRELAAYMRNGLYYERIRNSGQRWEDTEEAEKHAAVFWSTVCLVEREGYHASH